jgi:hypothetical protein
MHSLIRRAVEQYTDHLESVLGKPEGSRQDLRERWKLRSAAKWQPAPMPANATCVTPVRPLSELAKEHRATRPTVLEQLRAASRRMDDDDYEPQETLEDDHE